MVVTKSWTLVKYFNGAPKPEDFKLVENELPVLNDGCWRKVYICCLETDEGFCILCVVRSPCTTMQCLLQGKVKYHEHLTNGFEKRYQIIYEKYNKLNVK